MWTDETRTFVRMRWAEGRSASEISAEYKERYGVRKTRNAIIGYVHRAGLSRKDGPTQPKRVERTSRRNRVTKVRAPRTPKPAPPEPLSVRKALILSLEPIDTSTRVDAIARHQCRFIHGDPRGEWAFCARPKQHGSSFCVHHTRLCYRVAPVADEQAVNV